MGNLIYHLTSEAEWDMALSIGEYQPQQFARDGFIHFSYLYQLVDVANRFYRGGKDLVVVAIEPSSLPCEVIAENLESGTELFPHIYGKLPLNAAIEVMAFPCNLDGSFALPRQLLI